MKKSPLLAVVAGLAFALCSGCQMPVVRKDPITILAPHVEAGGKVTVNGVDPNRPQKPFTWTWGDGHTEIGWFPLTHIYEDTKRDYVLTVTAYYDDGQTGQGHAVISFQKKEPNHSSEPARTSVTSPADLGAAPSSFLL